MLSEVGQHVGKVVRRKVLGRAETNLSLNIGLSESADRFPLKLNDLFGIAQENLSLWRERDLAAGPVEEIATELLFEFLDLQAERRLGPVHHRGGLTERPRFRNRHKTLELSRLDKKGRFSADLKNSLKR